MQYDVKRGSVMILDSSISIDLCGLDILPLVNEPFGESKVLEGFIHTNKSVKCDTVCHRRENVSIYSYYRPEA